jgi:hypothetical protein
MIYRDIYEKAASIIGRENVEDYRPAVYEVPAPMDSAITIWLKNGDVIIYKAMEDK